jgi:arylformamidase
MIKEQISSRWIDISVLIGNDIVHWPGDPPFEKTMVAEIQKGNNANLSKLTLGAHTGTHVDAPRHFVNEGIDVSMISIEVFVGAARVIEILDRKIISVQELKQHKIRRNERLLFKTRNSSYAWKTDHFVEDFVALSLEAAEYLVQQGVKMIGVDYLSVGPYHGNGGDIHRQLLSAQVGIIEGLNLSAVNPGRYYLVCLPLKIKDGDGAPARAMIRAIR